MELEELEKIWKTASHQPLGREEVEKMLQQRSGTDISKMKSNLLIELLIVLISVAAVSIFFLVMLNGRLQEVAWFYILLAIVFLTYYYAKNKVLKSMLTTTGSIRQNLERQLKKLDTYIRYYMIIGSLLAPIIMTAFYFLLDYKDIPLQIFGLSRSSDSFTVLYFLCTIVLTFTLFFFNKWNVNLLYGRYSKRLKSLLAELTEQ